MIKKYHSASQQAVWDARGNQTTATNLLLTDECYSPDCRQAHIHMIDENSIKEFVHRDSLLPRVIEAPGVDVVDVHLWPHQELRVTVRKP